MDFEPNNLHAMSYELHSAGSQMFVLVAADQGMIHDSDAPASNHSRQKAIVRSIQTIREAFHIR